jgi:hypothetical protein
MSDANHPVGKAAISGFCRFAFSLAVASLIGPPLSTAATAAKDAPKETGSAPHVYLMRGLMNIFSLGMDELASKIARSGVSAAVYNHTQADAIVAQIVQSYRAGNHGPVILVGHSLGADAVMTMAQSLNRSGVPVALVVPFDGTSSFTAPKNVACVINLTQREYAYMRAGSGFHGKLQNVDVSSDGSIDHFTIDKSPRLQTMALNSILQAARGQSCHPGTAEPTTVAKPKTPPENKEPPAAEKETPTRQATPLREGIEG